ncbi:dihydrolipoamide acyltransferase [Sphingomonas sp. Root710]|uniref:biotin/lipoyl-containing protein n=1 Tax=Sphingomonas sp. Root710 TaxID=1736594 RepID=UPI0006FF9D33|nr:lipoyl domain-containing protein [Sphingomonas sp. Root710]KRB82998.1 dihydrolipoamide acyltransferase [Sphingomonas sp. Root710]
MATELTMPQLSMSMTEGDLVEWLVPDGSTVNEGDPVYAVESEKSTQEVTAPVTGVLRQAAAPGETYAVGTLLGEIV